MEGQRVECLLNLFVHTALPETERERGERERERGERERRERERGNNERNAGISGAITKTLRSVNGLFGTGDTHNH